MSIRSRFATLFAVALLAFAPIAAHWSPQSGLEVGWSQASAQSMSDYAENKATDLFLRGQAFTAPATLYFGLSTAACSDSSVGTEVTGGSYGRVSVTANLTNWSGTQSAGSTAASSGTGGVSSNNVAVSFTTPSASWGTVTHWFISDASSGGNILFCASLTTSKTINSGDSVSFAIAAVSVTFQ